MQHFPMDALQVCFDGNKVESSYAFLQTITTSTMIHDGINEYNNHKYIDETNILNPYMSLIVYKDFGKQKQYLSDESFKWSLAILKQLECI